MDSRFCAVDPGWQVLDPVLLVRETWIPDSTRQAPAVKKVDNAIHGKNLYPAVDSAIGPLQLVIHVVQNLRAGEQKSHWDKTNKENYNLELCMSFVCLVPVRLLLSSVQFYTT